MKILILGTGKSGTTALVYKLAAGLPNCRAFSGGKPGKYIGDFENAVYKHTYAEDKGKTFDLFREHLAKEQYDRKIWIARDPRDVAVSRMLYRWHRGLRGAREQYEAHLKRVQEKEQDPTAIAFCEICRYTGHGDWPRPKDAYLAEENRRYQKMGAFVHSLGSDWYMFKYEDMIQGQYADLNQYLGFDVQDSAEVPKDTGKAKVVRKKASGDWRLWFTAEDVSLLEPVYRPYMEQMKYDCNDWTLDPQPVIEPAYSSQYMQKLAAQKSGHSLQKLKDRLLAGLRK